jgi:hypothetical protein
MVHMLLAVLLSAGSVALLLTMGLITDGLLGEHAEGWARRHDREPRSGEWHS